MENTATLTTARLAAAAEDDRYASWGYLNGRIDLAPADRDAADAALLDYANLHGWTYDWLFHFVNSRPGRHYADAASAATPADLDAALTRLAVPVRFLP